MDLKGLPKTAVGTKGKNRKLLEIIIGTLLLIILVIYIGPVDGFTHGYFVDEVDYNQIIKQDFIGTVSLEESYEMRFSPQKAHMNGVEIYLVNQPEDNAGKLILSILDNDSVIDTIVVDLSEVKEASWYKVYTTCKLSKGKEYSLRFTAEGYKTVPYLQNVSEEYLPSESLSGNILISYAYAEPTFTVQDKIMIVMLAVAMWLFVYGFFFRKEKVFFYIAFYILGVAILSFNYINNSMDVKNENFTEFQADSETLVTGVIYAERNDVSFIGEDEHGYGLGRYYDLKGELSHYRLSYRNDNDWLNGYSRTESAIIVNSNRYSQGVAIPGNYILFTNGDVFEIIDVAYNQGDGSDIIIYLNSKYILNSAKNGSLDDAIFLDSDYNPLPRGRITAYKSQYGFQGKVFRHMARHMEDAKAIEMLNMICSIAAAIVFMTIIYLISLKYNNILAGCFFVTFWLSPWIVNFARNLYWVEFTWFIPMAIGLFCAWKINDRKCRIISYISTLIAIMGKCLCGYEYISTIMMGLISFLLVDLILAFINRDRQLARLLFRTIFIIAVMAMAGFIIAICIHARLRGQGEIITGIRSIFEWDVLRRTKGGDMNEFNVVYWASFNASIWEVLCKYFHFSTEVIVGIPGNLFPLLCIIPLCIFVQDIKLKKLNLEEVFLYAIFLLTSISWFCLAKSHSYIHTHMNYVMWYFGYIQICLYIIVRKLMQMVQRRK